MLPIAELAAVQYIFLKEKVMFNHINYFSLQNILLPEVILNNIPITAKNHSFNIKKYIVINIPIIVRIEYINFLLDMIVFHLLPIKTNADTVTTIIV